MTLQLTRGLNGPYVQCDSCKKKLNLPVNCSWGQKFIKPSLKSLGMTVKGPHVCEDCREIPASPTDTSECNPGGVVSPASGT